MSRSWNLITMIELCKSRNKYTWNEVTFISGVPNNLLRACQRHGDPPKHTKAYETLENGLKKLLASEADTAKKPAGSVKLEDAKNKLYSIAMLMGVENCIKFLEGVRQGAIDGIAD